MSSIKDLRGIKGQICESWPIHLHYLLSKPKVVLWIS